MVAIVPAWNEERNVGDVVREIRGLVPPPDVLVIDDGSSDDTARVAMEAGARVLCLPFNCGIGATVQAGIAWALERGYGTIVRLDGDGQHAAAEIPVLLEPIGTGRADFVVGSRYLIRDGFQSTWARRMGSRWFSFLLRLLSGLSISDPTSGSWAANARAARVLRAEYSSDYPEVDSLVRLARGGCRVVEVPVRMRARAGGRSSIDAVRAVYYMFKVTIALVMGRVEQRSLHAAGTGPGAGSGARP
jgi:glycosyltransferase involved in cell wall biosynthesis